MQIVFILCFIFIYHVLCCKNGGHLIRSGLTDAERQKILDYHNFARSCVAAKSRKNCRELNTNKLNQPPARNMQEMSWDYDLEATAQHWANDCIFGHDQGRQHPIFKNVGQNVAIFKSSINSGDSPDVKKLIKMWFDEHKVYRFAPLHLADFARQGDDQIGHYTQMVWANTNNVGCGYVYFSEGGWYQSYLVCNYGPAGNYLESLPYIKGQPSCESYGMNSSDIQGLCRLENEYEQNFYGIYKNDNESTTEIQDNLTDKPKYGTELSEDEFETSLNELINSFG